MKNSTLILFFSWIALAIVDIIALFVHIPLVFGVLFGLLNGMIIIGSIPLLIEEFRDRKFSKYIEEAEQQLEEEESDEL